MDDQWFQTVRERLAEIEREHTQRYASINPRTLFNHPGIVNSQYWHSTDACISAECFDWQPGRYPDVYIKALKGLSLVILHHMAQRPYISNPRFSSGTAVEVIENQKTLVARLLMLHLDYLLPGRSG